MGCEHGPTLLWPAGEGGTGNMSAQFPGSILPKRGVVYYNCCCGTTVVGNISGHKSLITYSMLLPQHLEWL